MGALLMQLKKEVKNSIKQLQKKVEDKQIHCNGVTRNKFTATVQQGIMKRAIHERKYQVITKRTFLPRKMAGVKSTR